MSDPKVEYTQAISEIDLAREQAKRLVGIIQEGAYLLQRDQWKRIPLINVPGVVFPPELLADTNSPRIDGKEWPTPLMLGQAFSKYHSAKDNLRIAWSRIPELQRTTLVPPEPFY